MRRAVFRSCLRPKTYEAPVCQGASVTSTSREARAHLRNYSVVIPPDCVAGSIKKTESTRSTTCSAH
jgi:hypothetical protein